MTKDEKADLIKRHAPILWMHENDAFLPEDCMVMESLAEIGTSDDDMKSFKLDELDRLKGSDKYFMDIPEIDFNNFGSNSKYAGAKMGPCAVSDHLREKFSNNKFLYPKARPSLPKYHARVSEISIIDKGDPDSRALKSADQGIFGEYNVVQYWFFYLFNDAWNLHIGDWDSTLEIFLKKDNSRAFTISYMHNVSWMANFSGKPQKLKRWIADWKQAETDKLMGWTFQYGQHPFVFVASGAHGGYPTPGYSIHGPKIFGYKIIGQTDYRKIGKLCIFPDYVPVNKEQIVKLLKEAGIETRETRFLPWEEPVVLDDQPWLKFKGLWGTKSEYEGWSGPTGPSRKKYWRMDQRRFKKALCQAVKGDYSGKWLYNIHLNWHGWEK
jgi:hypothetical protein